MGARRVRGRVLGSNAGSGGAVIGGSPTHNARTGPGRRRLRALQEPPLPASAPVVPASASAGVAYTEAALADEITGLPGLSSEAAAKAGRFRQFSGYLPISDYKRIFYWCV